MPLDSSRTRIFGVILVWDRNAWHFSREKRGCTPATKSTASLTRIQRGSTATSAMKHTCFISSLRWRRGSSPSTESRPSNSVRPRIALSAVVLPAPLGPIRPTMRPGSIVRSTASSATDRP